MERKKKNPEKKKREREKYYQKNGYVSEEVERSRAKGRWMNVVKRRKKQISKKEGCGYEKRENRYWMDREERRCRMVL
jgi:hypothetical protein